MEDARKEDDHEMCRERTTGVTLNPAALPSSPLSGPITPHSNAGALGGAGWFNYHRCVVLNPGARKEGYHPKFNFSLLFGFQVVIALTGGEIVYFELDQVHMQYVP